ncbi:MAG: SUMF1/EgtB/PvdO family nonheme iron enzyme [Planctomycetes bacterium]|nr:SUMF1/EgtB/PvdO family nonheme iron enzyme [Planctomycetota bacterium]
MAEGETKNPAGKPRKKTRAQKPPQAADQPAKAEGAPGAGPEAGGADDPSSETHTDEFAAVREAEAAAEKNEEIVVESESAPAPSAGGEGEPASAASPDDTREIPPGTPVPDEEGDPASMPHEARDLAAAAEEAREVVVVSAADGEGAAVAASAADGEGEAALVPPPLPTEADAPVRPARRADGAAEETDTGEPAGAPERVGGPVAEERGVAEAASGAAGAEIEYTPAGPLPGRAELASAGHGPEGREGDSLLHGPPSLPAAARPAGTARGSPARRAAAAARRVARRAALASTEAGMRLALRRTGRGPAGALRAVVEQALLFLVVFGVAHMAVRAAYVGAWVAMAATFLAVARALAHPMLEADLLRGERGAGLSREFIESRRPRRWATAARCVGMLAQLFIAWGCVGVEYDVSGARRGATVGERTRWAAERVVKALSPSSLWSGPTSTTVTTVDNWSGSTTSAAVTAVDNPPVPVAALIWFAPAGLLALAAVWVVGRVYRWSWETHVTAELGRTDRGDGAAMRVARMGPRVARRLAEVFVGERRPRPEKAQFAGAALARIPGAVTLSLAREVLGRLPSYTEAAERRGAASVLAARPVVGASEAIVDLFRVTEGFGARKHFLDCLGEIGDAVAVAALVDAVRTLDGELREFAARRLKGLSSTAREHYDVLTRERLSSVPGVVYAGRNGAGYHEVRREKDGALMIYVPPGTTLRGGETSDAARPQASVFVSGFLLDKHPVTYGQLLRFVRAGRNSFDGGRGAEPVIDTPNNPDTGEEALCGIVQWKDDLTPPGRDDWTLRDEHEYLPAAFITWPAARAFAAWVGAGLPSEAQWERACRAGATTRFPWDDAFEERRLWYEGNSSGRPRPVGELEPNGFGFHDMLGLVWEMTRDHWNPLFHRLPRGLADDPDPNETSKAEGLAANAIAVRGGAFDSPLHHCFPESRQPRGLHVRVGNVGFRCAIELRGTPARL